MYIQAKGTKYHNFLAKKINKSQFRGKGTTENMKYMYI